MIHTLKDWLWAHPLLYSSVLALLSALVSIYSQEIKRFLHNWPRTAARMRQSVERDLTDEISLLRRLHNNNYELTLYLSRSFTTVVLSWFQSVILYVAVLLIGNHPLDFKPLESMFATVLVIISLRARSILKKLYDYNVAIEDLQSRLAKVQGKSSANVVKSPAVSPPQY